MRFAMYRTAGMIIILGHLLLLTTRSVESSTESRNMELRGTRIKRAAGGSGGAFGIITLLIQMLSEVLLNANKETTCSVLSHKELVERALSYVPDNFITEQIKSTIMKHSNRCQNHTLGDALSSKFVLLFKMVKNRGIYPGTKWCGAGNKAASSTDLGTARATDECCRAHDQRGGKLPVLGELDGIRNKYPYAISSCDDEKKLFGCLLNDSSKASKEFGQFYYDVLQSRCYANTYPLKCIKSKMSFLKKKCTEYELPNDEPRKYQLFKPPNFYWAYVERWNLPALSRRPNTDVNPPKSWKLIEKFDKRKPTNDSEILKSGNKRSRE
ncbi:uncharacterized protein LOC135365885 [Ornithodoros turicata]|uniref:uncharacterized protein LOC135365885 n=1 Tax=Ornithodoros turicata TaxID=34597 RepID=UPI003139A73B